MTQPTRPRTPTSRSADPGLRRPPSRGRDTALVAVFAALVCALALAPALPWGPLGVPITLQTLGIMLCGAVLGPWRGALAATTYVVLGLAGLPVLAGGAAGPGVLAGPSGGFLLAYPAAALVIGLLTRATVRRTAELGGARAAGIALACVVGGIGVVYLGGIAGFSVVTGATLPRATAVMAVFIPGDLVKVVLTVALALPAHRAFPHLLRP